MKRYCIGDIHGGYLPLLELLNTINFDYENDQLIALGDVCDGWSQTPEAIELLMKIKKLVYINGNHDLWTAQHLLNPNKYDMDKDAWIYNGGKSTILAYSKLPVETVEKHLNFLKNALPFYIDSENNLYIHAGYENYIPGKQDWTLNPMYKSIVEEYCWSRKFWLDAYNGRNVAKDFNKVYIGHTPTLNFPKSNLEHLLPMTRKNIINMDTGACYTGKLSLIDLDTNKIYQSEKRAMEYYPTEKGRNKKPFNEN